jgi:hypothetical protein
MILDKYLSTDGSGHEYSYDGTTGQELTALEIFDKGSRMSFRKSTHDPNTHNKIAYDSTDTDGQERHERYTASGQLLTSESTSRGKLQSKTNCQYNSKENLTVRDQFSFGTLTHEQFDYDATGAVPLKYSKLEENEHGNRSKEEDIYKNGELASEDFTWEKGIRKAEHFDYSRRPDDANPGRVIIDIRQVQTANDGKSTTYEYEYKFNQSQNRNILHVKWKGANPDGSFSMDDKSRIQNLLYMHLSRIVPEL